MEPERNQWYRISNSAQVNSPALLVYPDRIEENIERLSGSVTDKSMLRLHVKTYKIPEIVRLVIKHGIRKFKCATIAEAEMTAGCGPDEVLLAYQPVGPNIRRFFELRKRFPDVALSCIADCEKTVRQLSANAIEFNDQAGVWLDVNTGMNRTGIAPGENALRLFRLINDLPGLKAEGLHIYDGHIHESDHSLRKRMCDEAWAVAEPMITELKSGGREIRIIAGGTPTFPFHAVKEGVETSPGTAVLWDYGYSTSFKDLDFLHAAVLFTRVISKPGKDLVCIDLGTKAVASEMPHPRIKILGLSDYEFVGHNEEHLVIRTAMADGIEQGDELYCIPFHICPTVDRYDKVSVVINGRVAEEWKVEARKRQITI
ncbi:MAG TPA: D-TA family PLP-dependent enzyme [Bacteroidales bacterium]|jgi:D-serine deaminase-like pyridoxal phosphate-dependent protein|nr:D-TA family PLP-dependent enzyme [Bacteroidales bacterium]